MGRATLLLHQKYIQKILRTRIKQLVKRLFLAVGYEIKRVRRIGGRVYAPLYSPWEEPWFEELFALLEGKTEVSKARCYILNRLAFQSLTLEGDFCECGIYKGGSALLIAETIKQQIGERLFHLFDTFEGMPEPDPNKDLSKKGRFADTSVEEVAQLLAAYPFVSLHKGFIPDTFKDITQCRFSFIHVDVDIYRSVWDCCEFFYSRLVPRGVLVFDDYGFPDCPGAKEAADEFFSQKPEVLICLPTGQCLVFKA